MQANTPLTPRLSVSEYEKGILRKDRAILSRAITLVESKLEEDQAIANQLIQNLMPKTVDSIRIGITGIPGVGKSTLIETLGLYLTSLSKRVAVLTIDPSSQRTGGSILGDKTRMDNLSRDTNAFIRPTSSGNMPGGISDKTRETILLCEASGFDVIIVETVGVGQSEIKVRDVVDFFMLLLLGGAGDELQGIKKGIMEMADGIVITKADGDNIQRAKKAQADYQSALHLFPVAQSNWSPGVLISSAIEKKGVEEIWDSIQEYKNLTMSNNFFALQRKNQNIAWFHASVDAALKYEARRSPALRKSKELLEKKVKSGALFPTQASQQFVKEFIDFLSRP